MVTRGHGGKQPVTLLVLMSWQTWCPRATQCDTSASASVLVLPSDTSASAAGRSARNEEGGAVH